MLQLMDLVNECVDFFKQELDISNAVGIYRYFNVEIFFYLLICKFWFMFTLTSKIQGILAVAWTAKICFVTFPRAI